MTTSLIVAEVFGKLHKNVLDSIRAMEPAWEKVTGLKFKPNEYTDSRGRKQKAYEITKNGFAINQRVRQINFALSSFY